MEFRKTMRQKWKLPSKSLAVAVRAPKPKPPRPRNCASTSTAAHSSSAAAAQTTSREGRRFMRVVYTFTVLFTLNLLFHFSTFELLNFSTSSTSRDVFVTGATGYIGRRLTDALVARGHRV